MPVYGPGNFASFSDDASVGTVPWDSPQSDAQTNNDVDTRAVDTAAGFRYSHYLKALNANPAIQEGEIPSRLKIRIRRCQGAYGQVWDEVLKPVIGGVVSGNNKAATAVQYPFTPNYAYAEYDYTFAEWGISPTVAQLNAADFGVVLQCESNTTSPLNTGPLVDHIDWEITTDPAPAASFIPQVRVNP